MTNKHETTRLPRPTFVGLAMTIACATLWGAVGIIDKSESVFFSPEEGKQLETVKSFPIFWWNFFAFQPKPGKPIRELADQFCDEIKTNSEIAHLECKVDPFVYLPIIQEWSRDIVIREPYSSRFRNSIQSTLAKLSLPLSPEMFQFFRLDPLSTFSDLQKKWQQRFKLGLEWKEGYFISPESGMIAIPVQFKRPANQSESIEFLVQQQETLCKQDPNCEGAALIGPHGATLANKGMIMNDLSWVSFLGIALLALEVGFIVWMGQWRLMLILIPVGLSMGVAALLTIAIYGKIHGLVLAFGGGIVGLIMDYGLHAAFYRETKQVWRSNIFGFLTTLICLVIIAFSQVPLLRQLLIFSIFGFVFGYLFLFLCRNWIATRLYTEPMALTIPKSHLLSILAILSVVSAFIFPWFVKPQFDIRQFETLSPIASRMTRELFQKSYSEPPLMSWDSVDGWIERAHQEKQFADTHQLQLESIANYLPTQAVQASHLATWQKVGCTLPGLSSDQKKLFAPFLSNLSCQTREKSVPSYSQHLEARGLGLSVWFPKTNEERELIQKNFKTLSLKGILDQLPTRLMKEVGWMFPLALTGIFLALWFYYRRFGIALLGLVPFLGGMGFTYAVSWITGIPLSFISLIGLIMVLAFSFDYSIFILDLELGRLDSTPATLSGLWYAAITTIVGFVPLLFCEHRVLLQLGMALVCGAIGSLLGGFWGIPLLLRRLK